MLRSYRCIVIAAFGWLILAASPPSDAASNTQANTQAKVAKSAPATAAAPGVKTVNGAKYKAPCKEPNNHEPCDLEAQWKAADAADKTAWWTVIQTILSAAGFIGLLISLYYTRKAVLAAEDATRDADAAIAIAERGAIASAALVEVSRDTANKQLRGYVSISRIGLSNQDGGINVTIDLKNSGATPAHSLRAEVGLSVLAGDVVPSLPKCKFGPTLISAVLEPGATRLCLAAFPVANGHAAVNGDNTVQVHGIVHYRDIFGEPRQTRFDWFGNPTTRILGMQMTPSFQGNGFT